MCNYGCRGIRCDRRDGLNTGPQVEDAIQIHIVSGTEKRYLAVSALFEELAYIPEEIFGFDGGAIRTPGRQKGPRQCSTGATGLIGGVGSGLDILAGTQEENCSGGFGVVRIFRVGKTTFTGRGFPEIAEINGGSAVTGVQDHETFAAGGNFGGQGGTEIIIGNDFNGSVVAGINTTIQSGDFITVGIGYGTAVSAVVEIDVVTGFEIGHHTLDRIHDVLFGGFERSVIGKELNVGTGGEEGCQLRFGVEDIVDATGQGVGGVDVIDSD